MSSPADPCRPSRVRYQVLAGACVLALLTYVNRLGFGVAAPEIKRDLDLTDEQMGYLASAFLIAYGLCQVPGGLVGDRIGGRNLLTIVVLGWSLLSGATALGGVWPTALLPFVFLLVLRFLFGIFQAAEFPTLVRVLADWMPVGERGSAQGLVWTFSRLGGTIVPFLFAGLLGFFGTWTTPFWIMAALGVLWCVVFWPWFRNRPDEMARVNDAERAVIAAGRVPMPTQRAAVPWTTVLRSSNVWSLCLVYALVGFAGNFFTNMLPLYLRDHRGLTKAETAWLSALPLAVGIGSCLLGGLLSDWIVRRTGSRKWGRRLNGAVGLLVAAAATLAIPWVQPIGLLAVMLCTAFFCNDLNMAPAWAAATDIGERYAGTVSGLMNMVGGGFAAALGTAFAGFLFRRELDSWVFVVFACSYVLAAVGWLLVDAEQPITWVPAVPAPRPNADCLVMAATAET